MDITELAPGDKVLIEATVTKVVDDAEGEPPVVLVSIEPAHRIDGNISALVMATSVATRVESQAPPTSEAWPLGTLDVSHETQRSAMDRPA